MNVTVKAIGALVLGFFAFLIGLLLLFTGGGDDPAGCADNTPATSGGPTVPAPPALADIPANYLRWYIESAKAYNLGGDSWIWLAAVGSVETDHGRLKAPGVTAGSNYAGASGPMQFMPGTWNGVNGAGGFGVDGNKDGKKDIYDPRDAIPAAAKYLKHLGAPNDWPEAVLGYNNHWRPYLEMVRGRYSVYRAAAIRAIQTTPTATPVSAPTPAGQAGQVANPTTTPYPIIQTPADHATKRPLGNWQSDNAIDIAMPRGTPILAVDDGTITKITGTPPRPGPFVIGGYSITLTTPTNAYYYTHLSAVRVTPGQRVTRGQPIGASGYANNVDHLHLGVRDGDPMRLWSNATPTSATPTTTTQQDACPGTIPTGPANLGQAVVVSEPRTYTQMPDWAAASGYQPQPFDTRLLPDALWILKTYNVRVTAAREPGHNSHGDGTSLDLAPAAGRGASLREWDATIGRLARDIGWTERCARSGVAPACPLKPWVRFVGYNGYPSHGDPAHEPRIPHLHISWQGADGTFGLLVAPQSRVRAFPVPDSGVRG